MPPHSTNDGRPNESEAVPVRSFPNHAAADLAAAALRAYGIPSRIKSDDVGGMLPPLSGPGVTVLVRAVDAEAALALLETQPSPAEMDQLAAQAAAGPVASVVGGEVSSAQFLAGMAIGLLMTLLYQWGHHWGTTRYYGYAEDDERTDEWVYRNGQLVEHLQDRNRDGAWDHWAYYHRGWLVRSEFDNNFDGVPDERWTFSGGLPVRSQRDTDFNGIPDEFCTYQHGHIHQVDWRPNGLKYTTVREVFRHGVLVEILRGGDPGGQFKERVRYGPFFNALSTHAALSPDTPR